MSRDDLQPFVKHFLLKQRNEDFIVKESLIVNPSIGQDDYQYFILIKSGLTTFESIDAISQYFSIDKSSIGVAGLKDEDAITEQIISLPAKAVNGLIDFNRSRDDIELFHYGYGARPITVGSLVGNAFKITLRKIPKNLFFDQKKGSILFLNYYGPQRFGVPNSAKTTHQIGQALLESDYDQALTLIREQKSSLGEQARDARCAKAFFEGLESRQLNFLKSAYYSYDWNQRVKQAIGQNADSRKQMLDDIGYVFSEDLSGYIKENPYLKYKKPDYYHKEQRVVWSVRQTVVQLNYTVEVCADEFNKGYDAAIIETFLPSGSYATIALAQLVTSLAFKR